MSDLTQFGSKVPSRGRGSPLSRWTGYSWTDEVEVETVVDRGSGENGGSP